MRWRHSLTVLLLALVLVLLLAYPQKEERISNQKALSNPPNCWLNISVGAEIAVQPHDDIIHDLSVNCRGDKIVSVSEVELDGLVLDPRERNSLRTYEHFVRYEEELSQSGVKNAIDSIIILPGQPLSTQWTAGQHTIKVVLDFEGGRKLQLASTFSIKHVAGDKTEVGDYLPQETSNSVSVLPSNSIQSPAAGACSYLIVGVAPYFYGPDAGIPPGTGGPQSSFTATNKKAYFISDAKPKAETVLSNAMRQGQSSFSGITLSGSAILQGPLALPPGELGWNQNGIALLKDAPSGRYFGVGLPDLNHNVQASANFRAYVNEVIKPLVPHGAIPIILGDKILHEDGTTAGASAYYDPNSRYIAMDLFKQATPEIAAFLIHWPETPYSEDFFGEILAHELGHSFGLAHNLHPFNVMSSPAHQMAHELEAEQACLVRYRCLNQKPPPVLHQPYENTCDSHWLETGGFDGASEECESDFLSIGAAFGVNCTLNNPTPNGQPFDFGAKPDGSRERWGNLNTPYWCYRQIPAESLHYMSGGSANVNRCRVREFCGNKIIESEMGEECDPQSTLPNQGCESSGTTCGGTSTDSSTGKKTIYHCRCIKPCQEGETFVEKCGNECCAPSQTCNQETHHCEDEDVSRR